MYSAVLETNIVRNVPWHHVQPMAIRKTLIFPIKETIEMISRVAFPWERKRREENVQTSLLLRSTGAVLPDRPLPVSQYNASRVPSGKWARLFRSLIGKLRIASCGRWMPATKQGRRRECPREKTREGSVRCVFQIKKSILYPFFMFVTIPFASEPNARRFNPLSFLKENISPRPALKKL